MYYQCEGGTKVTIQGLDCWIPKRPRLREEIANFHLSPAQQKWRRQPLPTFKVHEIDVFSGEDYDAYQELSWEDCRREEIIKQTGYDPHDLDRTGQPKPVKDIDIDPYYFCKPLDEYRKKEIDKVMNGTWFYNYNPETKRSEATYITGTYYLYLNYWKMDTGYPEYRETDRDLFYAMEYVEHSPVDFGLIVIGKRGFGKSYIMGCVSYKKAITVPRGHVGIQSKTDKDASELFSQKIVEPYKDLPDFLIPTNKNGNNPTTGLYFSPPSQKGRAGQIAKKAQREALRSKLDFQSSGEKAYDGTTLAFYGADEIGKTPPKVADVYERWMVVRQCQYRSSVKRGWSLQTTTVEKLEEGGEQTKKLWHASDPSKRSENGRTISWMVRFFISALDNSHFDEYGRPDREKAKKEHDGERKVLENQPNDYVSYIQKNPYTIEEAFMTEGSNCQFNAKILQDRQVYLSSPDCKATRKGDFIWKDNIPDTKAIFVDNPTNGKWEVSWLFEDEDQQANKVFKTSLSNGSYSFTPLNTANFAMAFDPISHKKVVDSTKKSQAAAAVFQKFNYWGSERFMNTFVADYLDRPYDPKVAFEDIIIAAHYFGIPVLIENNKYAALDYFYERGYKDFVMTRPVKTMTQKKTKTVNQETDGIPSNTPVIEYYTDLIAGHVQNYGHLLNHLRIVKDWLDFDPNKTTKFDSGVSAGLTLIAAENPVYQQPDSIDVSQFFKKTRLK